MRHLLVNAASAVLVSSVAGQTGCVPLTGSTECPSFNQSSVSTTDTTLLGYYPWLSSVTDTASFDRQLRGYVSSGYITSNYRDRLTCGNANYSNSSNYYARYTTSYICNSIVQNSVTTCNLAGAAAAPLCSDSCAQFAMSEENITVTDTLCPSRVSNYLDLIRSDFNECSFLPRDALTSACIPAAQNEPQDCGFKTGTNTNLVGLCQYCRGSSENATDSCCFTSNTSNRCVGVTLPVFSSIASFSASATSGTATSGTSNPTASSTSGAAGPNNSGGGLSAGSIAAIVIGSILGALLVLGLLIFCCVAYRRRRRDSVASNTLNQPSPQRQGGEIATVPTYNPPVSAQGYEVLPGGRVARMSAMQGGDLPQVGPNARELYGDSPASPEKMTGVLGAIKTSPGSNGSSPGSNDFSSPEGVASGQSEQLPFFKDYYSNDDIHPNDKVSVLWAYQPRAGDEFELERGDMLRVVGIWDDGWATGVRVDERAEDYDGKHKVQRDSGVSDGPDSRDDSPIGGEIKAFPLVCVCLPEAWKKTVEGDSSAESGSGGPQI